MVEILVNEKLFDVPGELTLLQACEAAGFEIPRFCFHQRLSVAGNCRMCLVEVVGGPPKPVASCAQNIKDLRKGPNGELPHIRTDTDMIKEARKGVMEFLLINHPLDCPICDQGGECDLQDQALAFGISSSRFIENKRSVEEKNLSPLIKTAMTRCIHCTRCVRFTTEIAGIDELGATGRGEDMEITSYLDQAMHSELIGNVVDICPVGALNSKPQTFKGRPWEMEKVETIDAMDALGSAIRVDSKGNEVIRILPLENASINEEWISDKARYAWDGLKSQRLDTPYKRIEGKIKPVNWSIALESVTELLRDVSSNHVGCIVGQFATCEEIYALGDLLDMLGIDNRDSRPSGSVLSPKPGRKSYLFNSSIKGIDSADAILIVGSNLRFEAPVLNARVLKAVRQRGIPVGVVGLSFDLTFPYEHISTDSNGIMQLLKGTHSFYEVLSKAKNPVIIIGSATYTREDSQALLSEIAKLAIKCGVVNNDWNGFNIVHAGASSVGGLDLDFVPKNGGLNTSEILNAAKDGLLKTLLLHGFDEFDPKLISKNTRVIYIGSHGDRGAQVADIILPAAAYTEKNGTYVNMEGRPQQLSRAVFPPGKARDDWSIFRALSEKIGMLLPYDTFELLQADMHRSKDFLNAPYNWSLDTDNKSIKRLTEIKAKSSGKKFVDTIPDYYLNNQISRSSRIMGECSKFALSRRQRRELDISV